MNTGRMQRGMDQLDKRRTDLRSLFESGLESQKTETFSRQVTTRRAASGLDSILKQYAVIAETIKGYVNEAYKMGKSAGIKLKAVQGTPLLEKIVALVSKGRAEKMMYSRLKNQTVGQDVDVMLDNVELYNQAIDLTRQDLENLREQLNAAQERYIATEAESQHLIDQYKPQLEDVNKQLAEKQKELDSLPESSAARAELESVIEDFNRQKTQLTDDISEASFKLKVAKENKYLSDGLEENLNVLIRVLKDQGVILYNISKESAENLQAIGKVMIAVKQSAGAVRLYELVQDIANRSIDYIGKATKTLAAETSAMLTKDVYDKTMIDGSVQNARDAARILNEAVVEILSKYTTERAKAVDKEPAQPTPKAQ